MLDNSTSSETNDKNYVHLHVDSLRDTEQGILNYMLLSSANFVEIRDKLSYDDFTFIIHKIIFKYLSILEDIFLSNNLNEDTDLDAKLNKFAKVLLKKQNISKIEILDVLSQKPSMHIETDLEVLNTNSIEKNIALNDVMIANSATIENIDGTTWLNYINGKLMSVETTDISKLPPEAYDNFDGILHSLSCLDLENGDNEASIVYYGDPEDPDGIESIYIKKDVSKLKWFDDICLWADKYSLDEDTFPRNRYKLENLIRLDLFNKGINELPKEIGKLSNLKILKVDENYIKEFPEELYQLKNLGFLSCVKNEISYISEEIINLQKLVMFVACHNNIYSLPNNFFRLKNLIGFCLHGNKLT